MNRKKYWWVWLLVAGYIYLIFRNSMMIADTSSALSEKVAYKLIGFINKYGFYIDFYKFHHYVRKLAHFTEFAGLGFIVSFAMILCPLFKSKLLNFSLFLVAIPVMDETIQKFVDGRSSQVTDMFIDGSGFLFGALICYILYLIIKDLFFSSNRNN